MGAAYRLRGRARYASASYVTGVGANFSGVNTVIDGGRRATADQARAFDLAIADFTAALRLDPNNAKTYQERGVAYLSKGDLDKAIADFTQAIRLDPNDADAYYNRGYVYVTKKDYDRAIADFEAALRINPKHPNASGWLDGARWMRERFR